MKVHKTYHIFLKKIYNYFIRINPFVSTSYVHVKKNRYFSLKTWKTKSLVPNFAVIGAQKCATSSLHRYLHQHPDIHMSRQKEPCFFMEIDFLKKRRARAGIIYHTKYQLLKNYILQNYSGEKIIGESSTFYTMGNLSRQYHIPENMLALSAGIKLVYIIRNPLERIISHFLHNRRNEAGLEFDFFLENDKWWLDNSLYYKQLSEYLHFIKKENIHVLVYENFKKSPKKHLQKIARFLNVNDFEKFNTDKKFKVSYNREFFDTQILKEKLLKNRAMQIIRKDVEKLENLLQIDLIAWKNDLKL